VQDDLLGDLRRLQGQVNFLMVGTLEPRKGHAQVLAAFEVLWQGGSDVNLIIVGKKGWMSDDLADRLRHHGQSGKRLIWLEGLSDESLEAVYATSHCLIAASEGEGFGLPLIEAAQKRLPIIARDIAVFREVTGEYAFYFADGEPRALAGSILQWLALFATGHHPKSDNMPWLTWQQSAQQLLASMK
jgi:glycosyltransferase involved in cell wall biosynthesis